MSEGLLQLFVDGEWKYVCDDVFDNDLNGAFVACREMGFREGTAIKSSVPNDIFADNIKCSGTEYSLADCGRSSSENCKTTDGIYLTCTGKRF